MTDNHRHAGISAANLAVGGGDRRKNVVCFQRIVAEVVQLAGEDIEQDFGIRGGVDVAAFFFKQLFTQLVSVSQVTVVRQRNAVRRVDVERLCLGGAGAASRRVTNVTNTHIALHTLHMASFKNVAHQTVRLTQTETVVRINGDDACGILATMLKHR